MKLSDAIRLGAMLKPQCFGGMYRYGASGHDALMIIETCALGAASEAGYDFHRGRHEVFRQTLACPACHEMITALEGDSLLMAIVHLNDSHRWTREAIADWVQTIEDAQTATTAEPRVDVPVLA